ncbi:MAG: hypothetical protein U9Q27_03435 [Patescibacteria group bacterium]|nr:hypothetical protein [Patescibacteria group bacterium]
MDANKKTGRNENGLIRISALTRNFMAFNKDFVEIWPQNTDTAKRMDCAVYLKIFKVFSSDIKKLQSYNITENELKRVGFVTTNTFQKITGSKVNVHIANNVWIADDIHDTVIGADPEFLLFDHDGKIIKANRIMGRQGKLGCDGAMAEIRPDPAITPAGLIKNIYKIFTTKDLIEPIKNLDWVAGCYFKDPDRDYPIGGHIHIGNPIQIAKMEPIKREHFFKVFNKIMDELLAIPMIKLDGMQLGLSRRSKCSVGKYGYYGEWRICNGRLEHRTLSGLWLAHPILAECVFGTAKTIIDEIFRNVANKKFDFSYMLPSVFYNINLFLTDFNNWDKIPLAADMGCTKSSETMEKILNNSQDKIIDKNFLKKWYNHLLTFHSSKFYKKYIDGLYEILSTKNKHFKEFNKNIKINWLENKKFIIEI